MLGVPRFSACLQKERRKRWAEKQRGAVAEAVAASAAFARAHPPGGAALTEEQRKEREELEARVKLLAELDEKYEDLGGCRQRCWCPLTFWHNTWDAACAASAVGGSRAAGHLHAALASLRQMASHLA